MTKHKSFIQELQVMIFIINLSIILYHREEQIMKFTLQVSATRICSFAKFIIEVYNFLPATNIMG